jgi:phage gp36-like protein
VSYATFDDILSDIPMYRLAEYVAESEDDYLADGSLAPAAIARVDVALEAASELVDSYIQLRYPAATSSEMLKKICTSVALSYLVERRHTGEQAICAWARELRAEQVTLLEAIRSGALSIGAATKAEDSGFKMRVASRKSTLGNVLGE